MRPCFVANLQNQTEVERVQIKNNRSVLRNIFNARTLLEESRVPIIWWLVAGRQLRARDEGNKFKETAYIIHSLFPLALQVQSYDMPPLKPAWIVCLHLSYHEPTLSLIAYEVKAASQADIQPFLKQ